MDHVDVDGMRIAFERAGTGPALVLVHGAVGDSRVWRAQLDSLSADFTVVAWDAPGCGRSGDPPESFTLDDYADCLAGFIEVMGLERPHVLGHSFGGGLALALCRAHGELPASLVLVGAYAGWAGSLPADEVETRLTLALELAEGITQRPLTPDSMPGLVSDATPPDRRDELATIMADVRPVGTRVMARAFAAADLRDVLPEIAVPTLLLYGDADVRAPRHVAEALHLGIGDSTLVMVPGAGHEAHADAPEAFEREVRAFLQRAG